MSAFGRDTEAGATRPGNARAATPPLSGVLPSGGLARTSLALQATAGNRAVAGLLAARPAPVQRLVATGPGELDKLIGTGDKLRSAFGRKLDGSKDSFMAIRRALADYRSAGGSGKSNLETQAEQLSALDILCTRFMREHSDDKKRLGVIARLQDEVVSERAAVSKQQAQDIYQGNVKGGRMPAPQGAIDPAQKFGFKALSAEGKMGASNHDAEIAQKGYTGPRRAERINKMKEKYGLTDAEISAITIYSAGDFSYINPVTANSAGWLADQKSRTNAEWGRLGDSTIKEEGGLHAGMAMQGLKKMDPFAEDTYRGARFTPDEFQQKFQVGRAVPFTALASSSKDKNIALDFAYNLSSGGTSDPAKSVGVLTVIVNSGGRDISGMALKQEEAEVLILPGSVFDVVSIKSVDPTTEYGEQAQRAAAANKPMPTTFYVVWLRPSGEPRWQRGSSTDAPDPSALPAWAQMNGPGAMGLHRR